MAADQIATTFKCLTLLLGAFFSVATAAAQDCVNADPSLVLGGIAGDYELTIDPQDPARNIIYVSNTADGPADVVVARLDGTAGIVSSTAAHVVATNFNGYSAINGPEFVQKPTGELGALYAAADGIHGVFRSATPQSWHSFSFDVFGDTVLALSPPALPSSGTVGYPRAPISIHQNTYSGKYGTCTGVCYAGLQDPTATDVWAVAAANGLSATSAAQSTSRDGYFNFAATDAHGRNALYEAKIDGNGGVVAGTDAKLTSLNAAIALHVLVAGTHPITGDTIIFAAEDLTSGTVIDVWGQPGSGGPLTLIGQVPVQNKADHFRVEASDSELVLHYLVFNGLYAGSYTIAVSANPGGLAVGQSKKISNVSHGAEFIWMPAAHQFALFDNKRAGWTLRRCWVNP